MAESSGFFDAHLIDGVYDRIYNAEDFAKYFANFVGNGVFAGSLNELVVSQKDTADMSVRVLSGRAFINGYNYENDDELSLAIDIADGVLNRYDLIVIRWDNSQRTIRINVKKGTPAVNPTSATIQRDADIYELALAKIYIKAGATTIAQENIIDMRNDDTVCGFVKTVADNSLIVLNEKVITLEDETKKLKTDMNNVKQRATILEGIAGIESEDYPGCYYRTVKGITEWINPPMIAGVEYRTAERWENKVVYQKRLYTAKMTDAKTMTISSGVPGNKVISVEGYLVKDKSIHHLFPLVTSTVVSISGVISHVDGSGQITFKLDNSIADYEGFITIKYVK